MKLDVTVDSHYDGEVISLYMETDPQTADDIVLLLGMADFFCKRVERLDGLANKLTDRIARGLSKIPSMKEHGYYDVE